jgi:hypothetical protein
MRLEMGVRYNTLAKSAEFDAKNQRTENCARMRTTGVGARPKPSRLAAVKFAKKSSLQNKSRVLQT